MHVAVEDVPMEEDEELSNTLLNPLNNMRPTKDRIMEPVEEGIGDIHEPEAQTQDVHMDWSIKKPTHHDPEGPCPHPTGCTIKYGHKLKECPIYEENKSPFIAMEVETGHVDDDNERNKERMREMRQNEEYREKERADMSKRREDEDYREKEKVKDAAVKRSKRKAMSPERREETNRKRREMSPEKRTEINKKRRQKRAEEKAKKAAEEGNPTPDMVLTPEEKKEETNRKKRERSQQVRV